MGQHAIDHMFNNFEMIGNLTMQRYAAVKATTTNTYLVKNVDTNYIKRQKANGMLEYVSLESVNVGDTIYIVGDFCPAAHGMNAPTKRFELVVKDVSCITMEQTLWMIESPEINIISFDCQAQMYELMGVIQTPATFEFEGTTYMNQFDAQNIKTLLQGTLKDYRAAQSKFQAMQRGQGQQTHAQGLSLEALFGGGPAGPAQPAPEHEKSAIEPSFDGLLF